MKKKPKKLAKSAPAKASKKKPTRRKKRLNLSDSKFGVLI